ncbi:MAG TPA: hypothetical protein VFX79_01045 [Candidatus Saccharimonadales bacterium]|nr:hypothetical protein [Candidatus Saccharimonadales bacterium]
MRDRRNKKTSLPPSIKAAMKLGLYREIPRHELHSGSWQQETYDRQGRRFYESTSRPEPIGRQLDVHERAAMLAERGETLMVFIQACNQSVPYDEYAEMLEAGFLATGHPDPNKNMSDEIYTTAADRKSEEQVQEATQAAGSIAVSEAAAVH